MKLSHTNYRAACEQAFSVNMSNPTVYWDANDGFYVSPSSDLVPNSDFCVGRANYILNHGSSRSLSGSRREYQPIARGIRKFFATAPDERDGRLADYIKSEQLEDEYEASAW